jgi:uncharacterized protein YwgA
VTYLAQLAGFGDEFSFDCHHYGPYSEDLALGIEIAATLGPVQEVKRQTDWGGRYSIYRLRKPASPSNPARAVFLRQAKEIGADELELAATAAYLFAVNGIGRIKPGNPWEETRKRKPQKAGEGRLERAAEAYNRLRKLRTPQQLPKLPPL